MELDLDQLTAVRVLGMGATGTVFLVADRSPGRHPPCPPLFALKVVEKPPSPAAKPDAARRARWEVSVLSRLSHPFLPSLLGRLETPHLLAWALPYCPGGDLNALRHSHTDGVFSPSATRFYLAEVLLALAHLHSLGIVYRDLKPENVLVQASGHLTLTDFDLSRHLLPAPPRPPSPPPPPPPENKKTKNTPKTKPAKPKSARVSPASRRPSSGSDGERSNSFVGTEEYVAPEVVRGDGHGFAVDWWALGVLAYEMAYGRTPFRGRTREETFANILTRSPEFAGGRRSDLADLVERLLAKDPAQRLGSRGGAEEVKAHRFFRGVRWELLAEVARPPFLAPSEDEEDNADGCSLPAAAGGFSVRDYFKKLRQHEAATAPPSPSPSPSPSISLAEF